MEQYLAGSSRRRAKAGAMETRGARTRSGGVRASNAGHCLFTGIASRERGNLGGDASVDLAIQRTKESVDITVLRKEGDVDVVSIK